MGGRGGVENWGDVVEGCELGKWEGKPGNWCDVRDWDNLAAT